jgi:hypothetical protein
MRIEIELFKNPHNTITTQFYTAVISFYCKSSTFDTSMIKTFETKAKELAKRVNSYKANESSNKRDDITLLANNFIGIISEYAWKYFINLTTIDTILMETEMTDVSNQIDLIHLKTKKTIEVRSSFVTNGIDFAIFHEKGFDIIGPYMNGVKPAENEKDFYLRTLFHYDNKKINSFIQDVKNSDDKNPFKIYLVGGATKEMMNDKILYITKPMKIGQTIEEDIPKGATHYKAIPIIKAMDTLQIRKEIIQLDL